MYLEFATTCKIINPLLILETNKIARAKKNSIDRDIGGKIIGVTIFITVHRSDYSLPSTDQKTGWSIDIVRPTGKRILPDRNNYTWPDGRQINKSQ